MLNNILGRLLALVAVVSLSGAVACGKKEPTPAELKLAKANELFKAADYAAAGPEFEAALKLDPKQDVKIWEKGAFAYLKAGNLDKAAELLLGTLDPKAGTERKLETYRNLAGMYLGASAHDKAEQYFGEVMKLDPKDEQSLSWMAEIASIRGGARANKGPVRTDQLDLALARYDQVSALNPNLPAPYINQRIAIGRYLGHLAEQKAAAEQDARESKDKQKKEAMLAAAQKFQGRIDELKGKLEETNKKLGAANKAARASR